MKIIILLLLCVLIINQDIFCNDSILSKFHQNGYKIKEFRVDLISYSKEFFNFLEIKTFKYNRTTAAVNGSGNLKVDITGKVEGVVQAYKFLSNEYRHFPIRFQVNIKKAMEANAIGISSIKNCGNFTGFSLIKNVTYYACNFVIDETQLPPLIPNGRYKVDLQLLHINDEIGRIYGYGEVHTPMEYPKK